jgi:hypothetical protein
MKPIKVLMASSVLVFLFVGCAVPPAPIYGNTNPPAYNYNPNNNSASGNTNQGSTKNGATADENRTVDPTGRNPASDNDSDQRDAPNCTVSTPTVNVNKYSGMITLNVTTTVQSAVGISYVLYTLTNSYGMAPITLGYSNSAPYPLQFSGNGLGFGVTYGVVATLVDKNGHTYDSVCAAGFTLKYSY